MSLKEFLDRGQIKTHKTSKQEIENLFKIVERDLTDARSGVSPDWRFGIAYNAALKLCNILLHAEGYRTGHGSHHIYAISVIPTILGNDKKDDADYLDSCRKKRNIVEYDCVGGATEEDAEELIEFVIEFRDSVIKWLKKKHPEFI